MLASASNRRRESGFTVPELVAALVFVFLLLVAAGFVLRPQPHTIEKYQAAQRLDLSRLLQAINKYQIANNGRLPDGISEQYAFIGTQSGQVDLCKALVPQYLQDIPLDSYTGAKAYAPANDSEQVSDWQNNQPCNAPHMVYMSGYAIAKSKDGRVHVAVLASDQKTPAVILSQK